MSAPRLREAAALMRRERGAIPFYRAVADWLDEAASEHERAKADALPGLAGFLDAYPDELPLAVAYAYMEGDQ